MKTYAFALAASLAASWGLQAAAQDLNPAAYQAWVNRQKAEASMRRGYQSMHGTLAPQYYVPEIPSMVAQSHDYYRGPGGEIVTLRQLPKNALSQGYRFIGSYSAANPRRSQPASGTRRGR